MFFLQEVRTMEYKINIAITFFIYLVLKFDTCSEVNSALWRIVKVTSIKFGVCKLHLLGPCSEIKPTYKNTDIFEKPAFCQDVLRNAITQLHSFKPYKSGVKQEEGSIARLP